MKIHWRLIASGVLIFLGILALFLVRLSFFSASVKPVDPSLALHQKNNATSYPGLTAAAPWPKTSLAQPAGQVHPFRVAPPNHYRMADWERAAFLKNAQRLLFHDDPPNASGEFRRVSLYRTNLKYPLVRVEEMRISQPNGQEIVLSQNATSADHVVVRAQPGETADDVARLAALNGDTVLAPMHSPGYS